MRRIYGISNRAATLLVAFAIAALTVGPTSGQTKGGNAAPAKSPPPKTTAAVTPAPGPVTLTGVVKSLGDEVSQKFDGAGGVSMAVFESWSLTVGGQSYYLDIRRPAPKMTMRTGVVGSDGQIVGSSNANADDEVIGLEGLENGARCTVKGRLVVKPHQVGEKKFTRQIIVKEIIRKPAP